MNMNRLVLALTCTGFAACGVDSLTSVAETAAALEIAQADFCAFRAQADECRQTFDACLAAESADVEACRTALHDCLPPPPPRPEREGGGRCEGMGDGGVRPPPPPRPAGGLPPPPHEGGRGGHRGPPPLVQPDPAVVQGCRDALTACLAATPGDASCQETERSCVRDAFRAAFEAACADPTASCAALPSDACARLTQRCAEGVDGPVCN